MLSVMSIPKRCFIPQTMGMDTWRERARARMKEIGMTQERLAESLNMTTGGAQKWLAGKRQPTIDDINNIAAILRVSPAWLTHGITEEDVLAGLPEEARNTLRRFVKASRADSSPSTVWSALNAIADLSLGPEPTTAYDPIEHERLTRLIDGSH